MKKDEKDLKREEELKEAPVKSEENNTEEKGQENNERESFDEEKKAYMAERLEFEAARALAEEGLPMSFAKLLAGEDSEKTKENVALFKKEFMSALEEMLSKRLKGSVPKTGTANAGESDPFLAGFGM